ncbi:hypothetical protein SSX86_030097 [Deinandra increscens subsp. villosa]|uniref:Uncharacterized protein n=1 Tax=Deinandra increscens subsp. villosa TaxID=3103831 RepID=A0AAP0CDS8_9ASTR
MAALTRFLKPQFSNLLTRSLSTYVTAASEIDSQSSNSTSPPPLLTDDPKGSRSFQWVFLGCPDVGKGSSPPVIREGK